jgi:archaellum component FlaC
MSEEYNNNSYDAVLSRMEQKLDTIAENIDNIKKSQKDLESRVSGLEYFKYYLAGIVAAVSVGANYLMNKVKNG